MTTAEQIKTDKPKHYKYGGSRLELLRACSDAINASEPYSDQPAGAAADRGTRIHAHFEQAIKEDLSALAASGGEEAKEINIGTLAARKVIELAREHGYSREELQVEVQLVSRMHPEAGGTPDTAAAALGRDLLVFDLKTGSRYVEVEESLQLLSYAVNVYDNLMPMTQQFLGDNVHLYIIQPEAEAPHTVHVRQWSIPLAKLMEYRQQIIDIIGKAETNPTRTAGEHCQEKYCAARRDCQAYKQWLDSRTQGAFLKMLAGEKVEPAKSAGLAEQLRAIPMLQDFIKQIQEAAKLALMQDPTAVPGWGLADGLGNRTWLDEKALDKVAKDNKLKLDDYKPRQLLSPAKFESLLKSKGLDKTLIDGLTERPNTGAKLVEIKPTDLSALL